MGRKAIGGATRGIHCWSFVDNETVPRDGGRGDFESSLDGYDGCGGEKVNSTLSSQTIFKISLQCLNFKIGHLNS